LRDRFAALPDEIPVIQTATGYEIAVTNNEDILWKLTRLPESCTSWVLPNQGLQPGEGQLSLLAA